MSIRALVVSKEEEQDGPVTSEVTTITEDQLPEADVTVNVEYSTLNYKDGLCITGTGGLVRNFPHVPGIDFAGTVEAVGEGVDGYSVGDEVYGCAGGLADLPGTLAEYIVADAKLVALKPKSLSMREAAALPLVVITAYEGLKRA